VLLQTVSQVGLLEQELGAELREVLDAVVVFVGLLLALLLDALLDGGY